MVHMRNTAGAALVFLLTSQTVECEYYKNILVLLYTNTKGKFLDITVQCF